jgi:prostaglandin E receptor 4
MAFLDLIGQAATGVVAIIMYANNLQWIGGYPLCIYHGFAMVFFGLTTPLLVCAMSIERLLALR